MAKADELKRLYQELEKSAPSLPLATVATDIVPGEGNIDAEIMFIGEAPGQNEAIQRRPFVGRSGQLFRKTLQEAAGIAETEVYISNIVKVRPPENRDPSPSEILAYKPFLNQEIEIIRPQVIVTLGRLSMGKFLPDVKISQVHGRLHKINWNERVLFVLPMYHPAAALRATKLKAEFVADFAKLPKILAWIKDQGSLGELQSAVSEALL
ncbi:MAG: uracil-DNA glycosylase [bacterium]|nr:uracil-DNA glycosylase [bacterium]